MDRIPDAAPPAVPEGEAAPAAASPADPRRLRIRLTGAVQGVGLRPYLFRLAGSLRLGGFVRNDARGVLAEVEGDPGDVSRFLRRLPRELPPLAVVERVDAEEVSPAGDRAFAILESDPSRLPSARVAPDTATCAACLAELRDPGDRRFRYPFVNCTDCGPRFTIVRGVPYDRPLTTMAGFPMCGACRAEYEDPSDRRFHAQPIACPECGPTVRLLDAAGTRVGPVGARDPVEAAARALNAGAVLALKGLGGYHLACRADDPEAVRRLRRRKHREDRPFALMAPDLAGARRLVRLDAAEERLLAAPARPILLARRRERAPVDEAVAPGLGVLGVMLPYTPLHHLLLGDVGGPLVMTSGNRSSEPIAYRDAEALEVLSGTADLFLLHDRPIQARTDDSIVRVVSLGERRRPMVLRRSRGYVPVPLELPVAAERPLLACGAHLKNTFCLARGDRAWVGPHVGDLESYETLRSFEEGIEHLGRLLSVDPEIVAHDAHPEYLSTKHALERVGLEAVSVQHHHAHLAACLAEHGETGPAIGAIYDGTGYGGDGALWGGEVLLGDLRGYRRLAHLWPVRMPGGGAAVREPWRMACAWLAEAAVGVPPLPSALAGRVDPARWEAVARLARSGLSPVTTSMGRLFDAVAALCGVRARVSYEGQAAVELEAAADPREDAGYPLPLLGTGVPALLDGRETIRAVLADLAAGESVGRVAARFHNGLADATARACAAAALRARIRTVVLSGGVFQNAWLLERTAGRLLGEGFRVLVPERIPPNDGGIAFGQAAVAAARGAGLRLEGSSSCNVDPGRTSGALRPAE